MDPETLNSSVHLKDVAPGPKASGQHPASSQVLNVNLLAQAVSLNSSQDASMGKLAGSINVADSKSGALTDASARAVPAASLTGLNPKAAEALKPLPVTVPVNQPHWGQATGERVLWMISSKLQTAEIQLDPPELGPLQVKVHVNNDQVSLTFVSQHAQVREALDVQALRLREMLEGQGLNLVNVDVSDQSFQQQQEQQSAAADGTAAVNEGEESPEAPALVSDVSLQLIDDFA